MSTDNVAKHDGLTDGLI